MELLKHRRILVRNSLRELEDAYLAMKPVGFEVDPDFKVDTTVQQALMDIHNERKSVTCGIYIMLEKGKEVAFNEKGQPYIRDIPPDESVQEGDGGASKDQGELSLEA